MLVNNTDAIPPHRGPRKRGAERTILWLALVAPVLAGCGDPTRPLIATTGPSEARPAGAPPRTTADGFPNVNVNPVDISQRPMPAEDIARSEQTLRAAGNRAQAAGRAAAAEPSAVAALQKAGATHAEEAAAAIATPVPAAPAQ